MADEKLMKVLLIAEDVVWYDWSNNDSDAVHTIEQLRIAVKEARDHLDQQQGNAR